MVLGLLFLHGAGLLDYGVEVSDEFKLDLGSISHGIGPFLLLLASMGQSLSVFSHVSLDFKEKKSWCNAW